MVFVCFKWYSMDSALPIIEAAADAHTVVIPILNIYGTGRMLQDQLPDKYILDGCIYVAASKEKPGQIFQFGKIMRIVFGPRKDQEKRPALAAIAAALDACGIEGKLSDHIEEEALEKFCYISPVGTASLYYDVTSGGFRTPGKPRDMLVELMREICAIGEAMGTPLPDDIVARNLKIAASLEPDSSTSMQRDVMAGHVPEMDGLVAEGEAEAIMKVQTALADSIKLLNNANPNDQVVKLKALESFEKAADGQATKIIVPSEIQSLAGLAASFKGLLEDEKK